MAYRETPRVRARLERRRKLILRRAARILARRGPSAVSLRHLIRRTAVGASGFYRWFAGKDAIVAAVLADAWARVAQAVAARTKAPRPRERFVEATRAGLAVLAETPEAARLYCLSRGQSPALDRRLDEGERLIHAFVAEQIEQGVAEGLYRPVDAGALAHAILGVLRQGLWRWAVTRELDAAALDREVTQFLEVLSQGLFVRPAPRTQGARAR